MPEYNKYELITIWGAYRNLVVSTPLKNISQNGSKWESSPNRGENINIWNHPHSNHQASPWKFKLNQWPPSKTMSCQAKLDGYIFKAPKFEIAPLIGCTESFSQPLCPHRGGHPLYKTMGFLEPNDPDFIQEIPRGIMIIRQTMHLSIYACAK